MKSVSLILIFSLFGLVACNKDAGSLIPSFSTTVEFSNTSLSFLEDSDTVRIPIIISSLINNNIEVDVKVVNQGAVEGKHFSLLSKSILIPARENNAELVVVIQNDTIVNKNRKFTLQISGIKGAEHAEISQSTQITIRNDDTWPEVQFMAPNYLVWEREAGVWVPYEVTGQVSENTGKFYQPMKVSIKFADVTADAANYYELPADSEAEYTFDRPTKDSIFIKLKEGRKELLEDVRFKMAWEVDSTGLVATNKDALIMIGDVKVVEFAETDLILLTPNGPTEDGKVAIPVKFSYVPSGGISAIVDVRGLLSSDYEWEGSNTITADRDTTLYAILKIKKGAVIPGTIDFTMTTPPGYEDYDVDREAIASVKAVRDLKKDAWSIVSVSSEHSTSFSAEKIIDNDYLKSWWRHKDGKTNQNVVIDMDNLVEMRDIVLYGWMHTHAYLAKTATVEVSMDGATWSSPYVFNFNNTAKPFEQNIIQVFFDEVVVGRYLKVTITEHAPGQANKGALAEICVAGLKR